jgi:hypothetical protein
MLRRLFTVLSALSLLLCVAVVAVWVRSFGGVDVLSREAGFDAEGLVVTSSSDSLKWTPRGIVLRRTFRANPQRDAAGVAYWVHGLQPRWHLERLPPPRFLQWYDRPTPRSFWNRLGFYFIDVTTGWSGATERTRVWIVPVWLPVLAFAALPAARVTAGLRRRWRRRRQQRSGRCAACGYDLCATPGRCPECGIVPGAGLPGLARGA